MRTAVNRELLGVIFSWLEHPLDTSHAAILADLLLDKNPNFFEPKWHEELCNGTASVVLHQYGRHENKRNRIPLSLVGSRNEGGTSQFFGGIRYNDVWHDTPVKKLFRKHLCETFRIDLPHRLELDEWLEASWQVNLRASTAHRFASLTSTYYEAGIKGTYVQDYICISSPLGRATGLHRLNTGYPLRPSVYDFQTAQPCELHAFNMAHYGSRSCLLGTLPIGTAFWLTRRMTNPTEFAMARRFAVPAQKDNTDANND